MPYLIGVALALAVCVFARLTGFDRERVFYPMLAAVIASYYILFAAMGNSAPALAVESLLAGAFVVLAVAGFKKNLWLVVAALLAHGVLDWCHPMWLPQAAVPVWWPRFCLGFDVLAAGFLAVLLRRRTGFASMGQAPGRSAEQPG